MSCNRGWLLWAIRCRLWRYR